MVRVLVIVLFSLGAFCVNAETEAERVQREAADFYRREVSPAILAPTNNRLADTFARGIAASARPAETFENFKRAFAWTRTLNLGFLRYDTMIEATRQAMNLASAPDPARALTVAREAYAKNLPTTRVSLFAPPNVAAALNRSVVAAVTAKPRLAPAAPLPQGAAGWTPPVPVVETVHPIKRLVDSPAWTAQRFSAAVEIFHQALVAFQIDGTPMPKELTVPLFDALDRLLDRYLSRPDEQRAGALSVVILAQRLQRVLAAYGTPEMRSELARRWPKWNAALAAAATVAGRGRLGGSDDPSIVSRARAAADELRRASHCGMPGV